MKGRFMKKILLFTALMTCLVGTASAKLSGLYVGGQFGYSFTDGEKVQSKNGLNNDLYLGYKFPLSDSLSLGPEIGFGKLFYSPKGKIDSNTSIKYKTSFYVPVVARLQWQINESLYLFGKAGLAYVSQNVDVSSPIASINQNRSEKKWNTTESIGLGYNITNGLSTEISYTNVDGEEFRSNINDHKTMKFDNWNIGLNYTF